MAIRILLLTILVLLLSACQRGPEESDLKVQIGSLLETEFSPGVFQLNSLKRTGSAPTSDKETGDERLIVYYNARLAFLKDYNLSARDTLGINTLAFLLGATDQGISGFKPGGNQKGDTLEVYGTAHYALRNGQWQAVSIVANTPGYANENTTSSKVAGLLGSLTQTYENNAGRLGGKEMQILDRELSSANRKINRQLDVLDNVYSIGSGPKGGNYFEITRMLDQHLSKRKIKTNSYETEGSVENCKLVQSNAIDLAITQNNVAAMAYQGKGLFRDSGAMTNLRAVASLFPEIIHIVVPKESNIQSLHDLKGKRIDIGLPESGSRLDALNILNAAGLKLSDFAQVSENGLKQSSRQLKKGELDAFFTTIESPSLTIQKLAASGNIRFLSLDQTLLQSASEALPNYITLEIPAYTYPKQRKRVYTLGVSALMVANQNLPDQKVWDFLDAIMRSLDELAEDNYKAAFISRQDAQTGITIPMHPGALAYFE